MATLNDKNVNLIEELWKQGLENGFRVIRKSAEVDYDWGREISNSRFDRKPGAIVLPKTSEHIRHCLNFCRDNDLPFRIRSGGHQHEGMSSLDKGIVIRLTEMNQITYPNPERKTAWIPSGKALKEVYDELQIFGKTIPGGGCWGVNVGGLALGGGWGTSARKMGLTCDNFTAAEVVLANGDIVLATETNDYQELFWALRGGGGGNFGIVTKFLFKLHDIGDYITTVNLRWKELEGNGQKAIKWYLDNQKNFPKEFTSVMSLRVKHKDMLKFIPDERPGGTDCKLVSTYFPLGFIGKFYGRKTELVEILKDFVEEFQPSNASNVDELLKVCSEKPFIKEEKLASDGSASEFPEEPQAMLSDLIGDFVDGYTGVLAENDHVLDAMEGTGDLEITASVKDYKIIPPPSTTCLKPLPHKISSGYPLSAETHADLTEKLVKIIMDTNAQDIEGARLYIVLHAMPDEGGGIESSESAFYYRNKDILVQFQSWWENPGFAGTEALSESCDVTKNEKCNIDYNSYKFEEEWRAYKQKKEGYINWVTDSRKKLSNELVGAFINFVDKDLVSDPTTVAGRYELLKYYYGDNLQRLVQIKKKYDPNNYFKFPMSIPLE